MADERCDVCGIPTGRHRAILRAYWPDLTLEEQDAVLAHERHDTGSARNATLAELHAAFVEVHRDGASSNDVDLRLSEESARVLRRLA
jgi:hypothetical protein